MMLPATATKKLAAPSTSLTKSFASTRLLLLVSPLILATALLAVFGPKSLDVRFQSLWVARSYVVVGGLNSNSETKFSGGGVSTPPSPSPTDSGRVVYQTNITEVVDGNEVPLANVSTIHPFANESKHNASFSNTPAIIRREYTTLDRLETGLQIARAAIRDTTLGNETRVDDQDYVPSGPMYWNSNAFHRSYLEMEKRFKVYVYREGEPPLFHNGPCRSIYSMEGNFISGLEMDQKFKTKDPEKAHVFCLPFSVTMLVSYVYEKDSHSFGPLKNFVADYIKVITEKYPYWNRSLGADHFMLACHDWGPEVSLVVPELYKNSIRVLCNATVRKHMDNTLSSFGIRYYNSWI